MRETLRDQWLRENAEDAYAPSILRQCLVGAIRGALLGGVLIAIIAMGVWLDGRVARASIAART